MIGAAATEKNTRMFEHLKTKKLEDQLWEAADQLRANSKLTASEYSMPVLGLIFLRHAYNRFLAVLPEVEQEIPARAKGELREQRIKLGFQNKAAIYLPEKARYDHIAALPQGVKVGEAIRDAMNLIEAEVDILKGALPKDYLGFETDLLAELVKIFNRPALARASGDVFGRIYEYFLNKFAQTGAQEGGEFFTPPSLVRMIVNVIEPEHGTILDPACGSAGMFVQTGYFIERVVHANANERVTFYGQEKSDTNTKLARMNLAVHGLEGKIIQGNTFYEDQHNLLGGCDFVMANPPFNVDSVDAKKAAAQTGAGNRLPFGLPGTTNKGKKDAGLAVSNANSLWIQYFYSYLNASGRAGFVMASSASDAGNKDKDIRSQLVTSGHVDVMIAIGTKFFYTRSLPCTLWFFDKGKPKVRQDTVLMLDARNVYHVVSARSHVFTDEQLANLSAVVWLYRGEQAKFRTLVADYQRTAHEHLAELHAVMDGHAAATNTLVDLLTRFAEHATLAELNVDVEAERRKHADNPELKLSTKLVPISAGQLDAWRDELGAFRAQCAQDDAHWQMLHAKLSTQVAAFTQRKQRDALAALTAAQAELEALQPEIKILHKMVETQHKTVLRLADAAEKTLRARSSAAWDGKAVRDAKKQLQPADGERDEEPTPHDVAMDTFKAAPYFIAQGHWLLSRFPAAQFVAVPGLCKAVTRHDIEHNDWSLTPGRYVGVAAGGGADEDEEAFIERMRAIHSELEELNLKAVELAVAIQTNFAELVE